MDIPSLIENGVSPNLNFALWLVCLHFGDGTSTWTLVVVVLMDL
jgi:hypothetical protein